MERGVLINSKFITFQVIVYICDAPARALVKVIKGHAGYFASDKCKVEGDFIENRVGFLNVNAELRTDKFKKGLYEDHIKGILSLLKIPGIKMASQFPYEYLHLVLLGNVQKILTLW